MDTPEKLTPRQKAARILGSLGGSRNTDAQKEARKKAKPGAGRPRKPETIVIPDELDE